MVEYGKFCEVYGKNLRNKALEYMLEMGKLDFAVSDLAEEIEISRPKAYEITEEFENEGILTKTRIIGKTQLYTLNYSNSKTKLLKKSFNECLKLVVNEYVENPIKELFKILKNKPITKEKFIEIKKELENKWIT